MALDKRQSPLFVRYEDADVYAIKALAAGKANEGQQQRAIAWIVNVLCDANALSFRPDSPRETDFAEGKRHVAIQIRKLVELPVSVLVKPPKRSTNE
jgi:hypothetical protein